MPVCIKCHKLKTARSFTQETSNPATYSDICLACSAEIKAKEARSRRLKVMRDKRQRVAARKKKRESKKQKVEALLPEVRKVAEAKPELLEKAVQQHVKREARKKEREKLEGEKKKELARRVLARRKLIHYIKRFNKDYQAGWVHHDVCRRLERFVEQTMRGEAPRLMLFLPPRSGKSMIVSDNFISWFLGHYPNKEVIAASYAVSLPMKFSRRIKERISSPEHQALFSELKLSAKSQATEEWETTAGGAYCAAGVDGGITGKGADIFVIDDPIKDAKEADSETVREGAWDWYGSTAQTRLSPTSGLLVVQTRWNDGDLAGKLIAQMRDHERDGTPEDEYDKWEVVEYPAIANNDEWLNPDDSITSEPQADSSLFLRAKGDALHPERFSYKRLMRIKHAMQPRHWSALYQQNPIPDEGLYFTKDMFRYYTSRPPLEELDIYIAFDLAIGEKEQNDYTVGIVGGLDYDDQLWILDMVRFKGNSFQIVESMLNLCKRFPPQLLGVEKGQLELAIKPQLKRRMRERRIFPTLAEKDKALQPISDKSKRARPLQGRMQQGMVRFPEKATWTEVAVGEMMRFPGGVHDDIVDAMAWLGIMVVREAPPSRPKARKLKSWKDKLSGYMDSAGTTSPMGA